ncbi:MAG: phage tail tip lysozyme [Chordicoccus sp.]
MKRQFIIALSAVCAAASVTPAATALSSVNVMADSASSEQVIFNYLTGELGLNTAAACGILGNMYQESGLDPTAQSSYYGLCQWSGSLTAELMSYCAQAGYDSASIEGQVHFLGTELTGGYSGVLAALQSVPNTADGASQAASIFCQQFEQCGNYDVEIPRRAAYANNYWGEFQGYVATSDTTDSTQAAADTSADTAAEDTQEAAQPAEITAVGRDGTVYTVSQMSAVYDFDYYINKYADLKAVYANDPQGAFQHFITYGMYEGRQASANFNVYTYRRLNYDLRVHYADRDLHWYYIHYITFGQSEGRTAVVS